MWFYEFTLTLKISSYNLDDRKLYIVIPAHIKVENTDEMIVFDKLVKARVFCSGSYRNNTN